MVLQALGYLDPRVRKDLQAPAGPLAQMVRRGQQVLLVLLAPLGPKERQARLVLLVHRDLRVKQADRLAS